MKELSKNFDFTAREGEIYAWWEKQGYFKPEIAPSDAEPFVISIPPPQRDGGAP